MQRGNTVWIPHVPRTAGVTRRHMLKDNTDYAEYPDKYRQLHNSSGIVTGHCSYCEHPEWIKILFYRHPRERIYSSYAYTRKHHTVSIEEWAYNPQQLPNYNPFTLTEDWIRNNQVKYGSAYIPKTFDNVYNITELDEFRLYMLYLGYDCNRADNYNSVSWEEIDLPPVCDDWIEQELEYLHSVGAKF